MADVVIMPRQGQSVESCIIAKWHKKKGDKVKVGDILFTYETDKSSFDEEAKTDGTLLDVFFEEGDDVECLLNVCVIGDEGEDISGVNPNNQAAEEIKSEVPAKVAEDKADQKVEVSAEKELTYHGDGVVKISPRAKNLANRLNIDVRYAEATGPNGRIIERDIDAINSPSYTKAASSNMTDAQISPTGIGGRISTADLSAPVQSPTGNVPQSTVAYEDVKMTNMRKVIAKSMHASLSEMAQLTLNATFDATEIMAFRAKLKANMEKMGLQKITINDIVLFAVSRTLLNHKDINANLIDDTMRYFNTVNLGVAVDTPRGLMVPTIFSAEKLSLNDIAASGKALASAAKEGKISPDNLKGGSFTVTNLGSFGVESFTPVINPPQTAILGVNNIVNRVREVNSELKMYPAMGLSLTFDHRAVDGAPAARFLKELCDNLENFSITLAK